MPVLEKPVEPLLEVWELLNDLILQSEAGKERDETHHRTNTHRHAVAWKPYREKEYDVGCDYEQTHNDKEL